ncbi:hypothetical protein ACVJGD_006619 [Bradyrhizobium sp. USDA 10063]
MKRPASTAPASQPTEFSDGLNVGAFGHASTKFVFRNAARYRLEFLCAANARRGAITRR